MSSDRDETDAWDDKHSSGHLHARRLVLLIRAPLLDLATHLLHMRARGRRIRANYLRRHLLCTRCDAKATDVHHIAIGLQEIWKRCAIRAIAGSRRRALVSVRTGRPTGPVFMGVMERRVAVCHEHVCVGDHPVGPAADTDEEVEHPAREGDR
jgi:hypothetical protein